MFKTLQGPLLMPAGSHWRWTPHTCPAPICATAPAGHLIACRLFLEALALPEQLSLLSCVASLRLVAEDGRRHTSATITAHLAMPKRKKQGLEGDEADAPPPGSATKRRRALNSPARQDTPAEHATEGSGGHRRSPAAMAAASGGAPFDDDGSSSEGEDRRTELAGGASAGCSADGAALKVCLKLSPRHSTSPA